MSLTSASKESDDESQLIKELSQGDPSAFEYVIREYGGYLLSVARRYLNDPDDAQDAVQESYLQLFKSVSRFRGDSSLKSWLHRITVNNALMKIRKDMKLNAIFSEDLFDFDNADQFDTNGKRLENPQALVNLGKSADEVYSNAELRSTVQQHIESLPAAYRNILLLRDIEGYSTQETADLLEISTASAKTGLHRARNKLKALLEDSQH